jgi:hypothetical protein
MASLAAQKKITNQLRPRWHRCISRHVLTLHYCSLLSSDVGALERLDVRCERYMHGSACNYDSLSPFKDTPRFILSSSSLSYSKPCSVQIPSSTRARSLLPVSNIDAVSAFTYIEYSNYDVLTSRSSYICILSFQLPKAYATVDLYSPKSLHAYLVSDTRYSKMFPELWYALLCVSRLPKLHIDSDYVTAYDATGSHKAGQRRKSPDPESQTTGPVAGHFMMITLRSFLSWSFTLLPSFLYR